MKKYLLLLLLFAISIVLFTNIPIYAKGQEHPIIKAFPGFTLDDLESEYKNFNKYDEFKIHNTKKDDFERKTVKGKYWYVYYEKRDASGNIDESVSHAELIENYKSAALEKGGKIMYEDDYELTFTIPLDNGNITWGHLDPGSGYYRIYIIEEKTLQVQLTFGADEIKAELDSKGHIAIYGILFDIGKATLKPEATKALVEIVKLMIKFPTLNIEIQGHTDNTGTDAINMKLSQQRADAVKSYILLFGVDSNRLSTKGYGPNQPVASNDTEEGRTKNRRVELVKK